MTIEKTKQGFLCYSLIGVGVYCRLHKKHYIGYTKKEAVSAFSVELDLFDDKGDLL